MKQKWGVREKSGDFGLADSRDHFNGSSKQCWEE